MKRVSVLLCLILVYFATDAQFKTIAAGPLFQEPEKGYAKILQLKNGNTLFVHITYKDGIEVQVYNAEHKQKSFKTITPRYGNLKRALIEGIFEIQENVVLFIAEGEGRTPVLNRLIIDGNTGALKEEEKIAELNKAGLGQGYAILFGRVPSPDFFIRKDPSSDNYALVMLNSFESDRNKRLQIVFYGSDHKEISRAYYNSPEDKYKYMNYLDMAVIGKEKVSVLAYAYNTRASGGKESELVLATLDAGARNVTLDELDFTKDMVINGGITRFNPVSKTIVLLAAAKAEKRSNEYVSFLATIDPYKRKLISNTIVYPEQANEKNMDLFGKKHPYTGMPQNLFINNDGSYSIVYQEIINYIQEHGDGTSSTYTDLENLAVSKYDAAGKETASYLVPMSQRVFKSFLHTFYHSKREGTAQFLDEGGQYKSFAYLDGKDKSYILINDIEENSESLKKGKLTRIQGVKECDGVYVEISGNEVLPERRFVFGKPENKHEHDLGLFAVSDYDREHNVYVTLKLEREGRGKNVQLIWLQPQ
jgi:hypothetical protein